jgi:hypothetical protein
MKAVFLEKGDITRIPAFPTEVMITSAQPGKTFPGRAGLYIRLEWEDSFKLPNGDVQHLGIVHLSEDAEVTVRRP